MNLTFVYLMYGLAYFTMGLAVWVKIRPLAGNRLAGVFTWLVIFGFAHAAHEWFEMFRIIGYTASTIMAIDTLMVSLSFTVLLQFGLELFSLEKNLPAKIHLLPTTLFILWFLFYLEAFSYENGMQLAEIWSRYTLGLLSAFLVAYVLVCQREKIVDNPSISGNLLFAGLFFGLSGLFTIVVSAADFFPASLLNYTRFTDTVGLPVEVFRMLTALLITYFVVRSLDVFDILEKRKLTGRVREMTGALKESEEKYRTLFELAGDAFLTIVPPWGEILDANEVALRMLGYSKEEIRKLRGSDIIAPEAFEETNNEWIKQIEEKGYFLYETIWVRKDGSSFPVEVSGRALEIRGQALFQLIGRDITERKQTEEKLHYSQEFVGTIFNNLNDSVFVIDIPSFRLIAANKAYLKRAGRKERDVIGQFCYVLNHNQNEPCQADHCSIMGVLSTGKVSSVEHRLIEEDGEIRYMEVTTSPIRNEKGEIYQAIQIARDITDRKHAEKALKRSEKKYRELSEQLLEANNMKELLLDVITHDLKNPAGVISGMAELLLDKSPDDEIVGIIKNSSDSLLDVVESTSLLTRVTMGEEIRIKEIDLAQVIKKVVGQFKPALKDKGMRLENLVSEMLPIKANPIIEEVFKNYIGNAVKYASEGKRIVIEAHSDDDSVTIAVKDFGKSIPKKDYDRIFVRKTQLKKNSGGGRGLGLAIVKRIAKAHEGEVWVEANKPKGNIFYLKLPKT